MSHYESDGAICDDGEIPKCSYCGATIFDTCISGIYCCEDNDCRAKLGYECLRGEFEHKED